MKSLIGGLGSLRNAAPAPSGRSTSVGRSLFGGRGSSSSLSAYGQSSTLFPIVNRLANATSSVCWRLYRTAPSGLREDRIEVMPGQHLALDIWNTPNSFYTRQEFVEASQQHVELVGESYWVVERNPAMRSIPLGMWPVRPDRMTPVPGETTFIDGYLYTGPNGQDVALQLDEVIAVKMPNPLDPYRGLGPVQAAMVDIDSARYSAEWNRAFFQNGAHPDGILKTDASLDDDTLRDIVDRWREAHQGVNNAHRVAVLDSGVDYVENAFSQRDMQFQELRAQSAEFVRGAFGFPKSMLGAVDDVNRANAEAGEYVFGKWLIHPRAERIKGVLNSRYLPLFGAAAQGLEFDFDPVVPDDETAETASLKTRADTVSVLIAAGFDPTEALVVAGLPPMGHLPTQAIGATA